MNRIFAGAFAGVVATFAAMRVIETHSMHFPLVVYIFFGAVVGFVIYDFTPSLSHDADGYKNATRAEIKKGILEELTRTTWVTSLDLGRRVDARLKRNGKTVGYNTVFNIALAMSRRKGPLDMASDLNNISFKKR